MKSGYDQFFKNARQVAKKTNPDSSVDTLRAELNRRVNLSIKNDEHIESELRKRAGIKKKKKTKKSIPWRIVGTSFIGVLLALYGMLNYDKVEHLVKNFEITLLGSANAEEAPAKKETKKTPTDKTKADDKSDGREPAQEKKTEDKADNSLDHLQKLTERKKELDAREEELNRVEQELQAQKVDLEKRMKELEEMRTKISSMLDDRVKADDQKVDTLVQMYTNMKAPQAAKIFETLDEDLAVEILSRMKKKNAAEIMNLLKAEKAQAFSEKFAGYKRK